MIAPSTSSKAVPIPSIPPGLDTPALVIDLDVVERNIGRLQIALDERGVRLRPHVKTHKIVAIARMQIEAGARGITVGTLGEAEVMADGGIDDIFVAYPVWASAPKAARLRRLNERIHLAVGVDSEAGARQLASALEGATRSLPVLVEIDSGGARTGVREPEAAVRVARAARLAGLDVRGVFTHGGHSYRDADAPTGAARDEVSALTAAAEALTGDGFDVETVSAGSTPTRLLSATGAVKEIRAGTYVLGDRTQLALDGPADGLALYVAATVVSHPAADRVVVDAGAKSLTKDRADYLEGFGLVPALPDAIVERLYDYHGVIVLAAGAAAPALGEVLAIVPNHVCPVVDLFDRAVIVRGGRVIDQWRVDARGRSG
jgi:D-serine deaminase-like pyridoxal phosphate-dependent protein